MFTTVVVAGAAEAEGPPPGGEGEALRTRVERDRLEDDAKAEAAVVASRSVRLGPEVRAGGPPSSPAAAALIATRWRSHCAPSHSRRTTWRHA